MIYTLPVRGRQPFDYLSDIHRRLSDTKTNH